MLIQFAPHQEAKGFPVLGAGCGNDLCGKLRAWRGFRPANPLKIVAYELFVERRLGAAGIVLRGGPEA